MPGRLGFVIDVANRSAPRKAPTGGGRNAPSRSKADIRDRQSHSAKGPASDIRSTGQIAFWMTTEACHGRAGPSYDQAAITKPWSLASTSSLPWRIRYRKRTAIR
jgi:hypothetical protein